MVIFNSYVKLPEGNDQIILNDGLPRLVLPNNLPGDLWIIGKNDGLVFSNNQIIVNDSDSR